MKKTIIYLIVALVLIGLTIAGIGVINKDKTVTLSKEAEQYYKDKGISPSYKDYQEGDKYWRCLESNTEYNLPCSQRFNGNMDETKLDNWQKERLEKIAQVQLTRESRPAKETIREGDITINQKK